MPRPRKDAPPAANSIIASAARVTSSRRRGTPKSAPAGGWQAEVWEKLDTVGELEFYRLWIANAMSRVELYVVEETPDGDKRLTSGLPVDALKALFGGEVGQADMLAAMGSHIKLPGETWLVGLVDPPDEPDAPDQWRVMSRDEVKLEGSKWVIDRGDGEAEKYEDGSKAAEGGPEAEALVMRIWYPHPRKWVEAHSAVRSALPILRELEGLTKHIAASIDSRLAGAGVLFVPQEMTFTTPDGLTAPDDATQDPFMSALTLAMTTAISDRSDAAAVVPIVVKAPAQYLAAVQHITFDTPLSAKAMDLRKEAITRLATALDCPAEVLTGMADVNHWTGWLLDESAIKMHIEPTASVLCSGFTTKYLWPVLQGDAPTFDPTLRRFQIRADTSNLRQRPNRSAEAASAHDSMIITDAAWARESGFENDDLLLDPKNAEELARRLLIKTAGGVTTGDMTMAALAQLGAVLAPKASEVTPTTTATVVGPAAVPAALPSPATGPPAQPSTPDAIAAAGTWHVGTADDSQRAIALLLGSEAVTLRAVERAWNKAGRRSRGGRKAIEADQLDACLTGAWDYLERVAAMTRVDPARLRETLDTYTRGLLATGDPHDPVAFSRLVEDRVLGINGA